MYRKDTSIFIRNMQNNIPVNGPFSTLLYYHSIWRDTVTNLIISFAPGISSIPALSVPTLLQRTVSRHMDHLALSVKRDGKVYIPLLIFFYYHRHYHHLHYIFITQFFEITDNESNIASTVLNSTS